MSTPRWVPTGKGQMWATWIGDAQVIYVIVHEATAIDTEQYWVHKKVSGAAQGYIIGQCGTPERAREIAEHDARQPL